jgi:hypothetical protein
MAAFVKSWRRQLGRLSNSVAAMPEPHAGRRHRMGSALMSVLLGCRQQRRFARLYFEPCALISKRRAAKRGRACRRDAHRRSRELGSIQSFSGSPRKCLTGSRRTRGLNLSAKEPRQGIWGPRRGPLLAPSCKVKRPSRALKQRRQASPVPWQPVPRVKCCLSSTART